MEPRRPSFSPSFTQAKAVLDVVIATSLGIQAVPILSTLSSSFPLADAAHLLDIHLGSIQQMFAAAAYLSAGIPPTSLRNLVDGFQEGGGAGDAFQVTSDEHPRITLPARGGRAFSLYCDPIFSNQLAGQSACLSFKMGTPRLKDAQANAQIAFEDASTVDSLEDVFVVAQAGNRTIAYERLLETISSGLIEPIFHLWQLGMIGNASLLWLHHFQALQSTLLCSLLADPKCVRALIHFGMITAFGAWATTVLARGIKELEAELRDCKRRIAKTKERTIEALVKESTFEELANASMQAQCVVAALQGQMKEWQNAYQRSVMARTDELRESSKKHNDAMEKERQEPEEAERKWSSDLDAANAEVSNAKNQLADQTRLCGMAESSITQLKTRGEELTKQLNGLKRLLKGGGATQKGGPSALRRVQPGAPQPRKGQ
ncbi:hypothetical protein CBOM_02937 [Ceraceosorus bombacis]|uniref:Uncharacterized protein n=1 Tax=Ceraceosorus bombacis TaxID=401625 RepID=A0A0P1BHR9_9BASI|nr:hypothetical protein CBOM_02937 [Ceraceosorus bombacis]